MSKNALNVIIISEIRLSACNMELICRSRLIRVLLSVAKRLKCFSIKETMNSVISLIAQKLSLNPNKTKCIYFKAANSKTPPSDLI